MIFLCVNLYGPYSFSCMVLNKFRMQPSCAGLPSLFDGPTVLTKSEGGFKKLGGGFNQSSKNMAREGASTIIFLILLCEGRSKFL
uniref:Uncharacterized protein n=1 Tax=Rhizoctonia solani TaxID=456999 RepID=N0ACV9_9AGAM|nr:hypothetical protein RSOL_m01090 [Rhizoctonia solani]AGK45424.1 hypothetical protein RSOL_m01090 [Rhizoctonia solani]